MKGTFTGIVDSSYTIYQSGSATINGFPYVVYTETMTQGVQISSSYIQVSPSANGTNYWAGIAFNFTNIIDRDFWMWIQFNVTSSYSNASTTIASVWHLRGSSSNSLYTSSGFYWTSPNSSSTVTNDYNSSGETFTRVDDRPYPSDAYFGPCVRPRRTGTSIWVRFTKIWIQFK